MDRSFFARAVAALPAVRSLGADYGHRLRAHMDEMFTFMDLDRYVRSSALLLDWWLTPNDGDSNGSVDLEELVSALAVLCGGELGQKLGTCFHLFDADGNGYLDKGTR